jgi:hypothetical protein
MPESKTARRSSKLEEPADVPEPLEAPQEPEEPAPSPEPSQPVTPPQPSAYRVAWWPAAVTLPDGTHYRQARVYATREGLYVYDRPGAAPAHFAPIDYGKTRRPVTAYPANRKVVRIVTADDQAILVQPLAGCGCGHPLKSWKPAWANRHEAWEG